MEGESDGLRWPAGTPVPAGVTPAGSSATSFDMSEMEDVSSNDSASNVGGNETPNISSLFGVLPPATPLLWPPLLHANPGVDARREWPGAGSAVS